MTQFIDSARPFTLVGAAVVILGSFLGTHSASAAPYCMTNAGLPPQCIYYDANLCRKDSEKQGEWCTVQAAAMKTASGSGQYCLALSQLHSIALCNYQSRESCDAEAARQ